MGCPTDRVAYIQCTHVVCVRCFSAGRVGLFDGLNQCRSDDGTLVTQDSDEVISTDPSQTLPLLIPAKHVAVISAVRSSPPPDLGLPMASAGNGTATDPDGPPVLELEMNHSATNSCSAAATDAAVADCGTSLHPPAAASENGIIVID